MPNAPHLLKKIFVVGAPRSGTSYLARALSLAEDVAYFEESGVFSLYGARSFSSTFSQSIKDVDVFEYNAIKHKVLRVTDRLRGLDRLDDIVFRMLLHTKLHPFDLQPSNPLIEVQHCQLDDQDRVLQRMLQDKYRMLERKDGFSAVVSSLFADFVGISEKEHLLEKTPQHIGYVPVIRSVFPDAKVVLIRRDKKDSVASFVRHFDARTNLSNKYHSDRSLLKKQAMVCRYYEQIEEWLAVQSWCFTVDYKQLIKKPFDTVQDALQWAGLAIDEVKYRPMFVPGNVSSVWDRLSVNEQQMVEAVL